MAQGYPELAAQYINQPKEPRLDHPERQTMAADPVAERKSTLETLPLLDMLKKDGTLRSSEHRSLVLMCRRYAVMLSDHIARSESPRLDDEEKLARRQALDEFFGKIELAAGIDTDGTFCESRECGGCPHAEEPIGDLPCKDYLDWLLTLRPPMPLADDVVEAVERLKAMREIELSWASFHGDAYPDGACERAINAKAIRLVLSALGSVVAEKLVLVEVKESLDVCRRANDEGKKLLAEAQAEVQELTSQIKAMETKSKDVSKELLNSEEYLEGIVYEVQAVISESLNATDAIQKVREIFRRENYPW
jgi:hypothetical protein